MCCKGMNKCNDASEKSCQCNCKNECRECTGCSRQKLDSSQTQTESSLKNPFSSKHNK